MWKLLMEKRLLADMSKAGGLLLIFSLAYPMTRLWVPTMPLQNSKL